VTPSDPAAAVAIELAGLRTRFDQFGTDLGEVKTATAVLVERSTRTNADIRQLRTDMDAGDNDLRDQLQAVKIDLEDVKKWRWTNTGAVGVLSASAGYLIQYLLR
jgi:hypothetical protein